MSRCKEPLWIDGSGYVPCGKCNFCVRDKRNAWSFRLEQEFKDSVRAAFVTLTYDSKKLRYSSRGCSTLCKRDLQLFVKRLRKKQSKIVDWKLRYYAVGEYGSKTQRPHYHLIIFNLCNNVQDLLQTVWEFGNVHIGTVTPKSIAYVIKYVIDRGGFDFIGYRLAPFSVMSRRPGLGHRYFRTHRDWHLSALRDFSMVNGVRMKLPRYYKDRIFSPVQRAWLAMCSVGEQRERYGQELEKLREQGHEDPVAYYDACVQAEYDRIRIKFIDNSKL